MSKPTKHFDIGISGSCFGSRPRLMVLMLFANSERVGAGTCPRLNLGAYFLFGVFNEQFFFDSLHQVDTMVAVVPPSCASRLPVEYMPEYTATESNAVRRMLRRKYEQRNSFVSGSHVGSWGVSLVVWVELCQAWLDTHFIL